jgi:uroporphyrinogen III methyltransferase/synthase
MARGRVYLVGAGPGDVGLLTIRGQELLRTADVVYYDGLVSSQVLRQIPRTVRKVRVAKGRRERKGVPQSRINALLVSEAKAGRKVVRLKGGDPFLLSRGAEEASALRANRIPFEVVPGVTSALAAPSYAGIPVTERGWASSVAIVTGRESRTARHQTVDWGALAHSADTLVVLMGVAPFPRIARTLLKSGLPPDTPVAAIRWATTSRQRTVLFTLAEAGEKQLRPRLRSPSVFVIGPTAARAHTLHWNLQEARWSSSQFARAAKRWERRAIAGGRPRTRRNATGP